MTNVSKEIKQKLVILNGLSTLCMEEGIDVSDVVDGFATPLEYLKLMVSFDVSDDDYQESLLEITRKIAKEVYNEIKGN